MARKPETKPSARLQSKRIEAADSSVLNAASRLLGQFPTLLAAFAAFLTLAALIHEWGFYSALGLSFGQSPIGVADQFKILLSLVPSIVRDASILMLAGMLLGGFEEGNRREFRSRFLSPLNDPIRFTSYLFLIGAATLAAILVLFRPSRINPFEIVNLFVLGILLLGARSILNEEHGKARLVATGFITLLYVPFWLYGAGYKSALEGIADSPAVTIFLEQDSAVERTSIAGTLLRSYDRQVLVRTADGSVIFLPTERIERIQFGKPPKIIGLICRWIETGCD